MDKKHYFAELLATYIFVLVGTTALVVTGNSIGVFGIATVFGLILAALTYTFGPISGCHVNPAVSIGLYMSGRMTIKNTLIYILVQVIGAILAIATLGLVLGSTQSGLGLNSVAGGYSYLQGAAIELIFSAIFVLIILGVTSTKGGRPFAGIVTGGTLTSLYLITIPISGTSLNPAKSIATAVVTFDPGALTQIWIYAIFPIIGGAIAGLIWRFIFTEK